MKNKGWKGVLPVALALALLSGGASWARDQAPDDSAEALYQTGMSKFIGGDYENSIEFLSELIKVFGREPELRERIDLAMFAKACAYYNLGQFEEAVKAFQAYLKEFPKSKFGDEALYRMGSCHQQTEDWNAAIDDYRRVLSDWPASAFREDSAFQIGFCHLVQENSADAAAAFQDFCRMFPDSRLRPQASAYAARALFDDGKPLEAIDALREMEERPRPWSVITYCNFLAFEIGDSLFDDSEYDQALQAYRRVKTRKAILRNLRAELERIQAEQAAWEKQRVTPQNMSAHYRGGQILARDLKQHQELLAKLEEMPDYDENLFHRIGRCYFNTDRYWPARVAFTRVVGVATDETVREAAHFDLILSISRLRRFDDLLVEADSYLSTYDPKGDWQ